jgi:Tol biopolymer transport system component
MSASSSPSPDSVEKLRMSRQAVRLLGVFTSAILVSFVLAGCGGSDESIGTETGAPETSITTETAHNGVIAFAQGEGGLADISVVNPDGSGRAVLVASGADELFPAWSPDGTKLAYTTDETESGSSSHGDIIVVDSDGSNRLNVTDRYDGVPDPSDPGNVWGLKSDDWDPTWSPDGTQIAYMGMIGPDTFESGDEQLPDIYVVDVDGSDRRNLTSTPDWIEVAPEWSPDGKQIAFMSEDINQDRLTLSVIGADGSSRRSLTDLDWQPFRGTNGYLLWISGLSWSPDGTRSRSPIAPPPAMTVGPSTCTSSMPTDPADVTSRKDSRAARCSPPGHPTARRSPSSPTATTTRPCT